LEVFVGQGDATRVLSLLKKGDFFGEMALLQGGKRTASVVVTRRAQLVTLDRASFNSLFLKNPKALEYFTRVLCKRVANANKGDVVHKSSMAISVGAERPNLQGKTLVAKALAAVLHDLTNAEVLVIDFSANADVNGSASLWSNAVENLTDGVFTLSAPVREGEDS